MKNILTFYALAMVFLAAVFFASCSKEVKPVTNIKKEVMTVGQLKAKTGIDLIKAQQESNATARKGGKPLKAETVVVVWFDDLIISGSVSCTTSPDAEWGGIQKFLALPLSNDGAVSYCNFNWSNRTPDPSMDCPTTASGVYRGWTSDKVTYDVHVSPPLEIP